MSFVTHLKAKEAGGRDLYLRWFDEILRPDPLTGAKRRRCLVGRVPVWNMGTIFGTVFEVMPLFCPITITARNDDFARLERILTCRDRNAAVKKEVA